MSTTTSATERAPSDTTNLDIYGDPPLPWQRVLDAIDNTPNDEHMTWWLGTVRTGGRPHAAGVGGFWHDGSVYFTSSPYARKARNLAENPAATIAVKLDGIDVVFEGDVERVTDPGTLETVAALGREGGWPVEVQGDAFTAPFSAPSAGPPPWNLYRLTFHTVFGVATGEPHGATRWRFDTGR
jgi:pyridoxamine 5'-phosphate oxidase-like protein